MFELIRYDGRGTRNPRRAREAREAREARGIRRARRRAGAVAGLVAALVAPVLAGPAQAGSGVAAGGRVDPVSQQLQAALDGVVAAGASGVVLRVDDGRRTYRLASGKARLDPPQAMDPVAKIRVGSITKSLVSTVTLQLVGEGRLSLDDTVERWQPGLVPGGAQITVRNLLNHTSGIFDYTDDEAFIQELLAHPLVPRTPQELIAVATSHPPLFAPGTGWSYSNTNDIVIGLILQRITHRSVSQLVDQRIVRPLGLRHTSLPERSPDIPGYHAHGYLPPAAPGEDYVDFTRISPTLPWAAGALVSNVDDLRRFYRALLGGQLLRPAQLAQMKTLVPVEEGFGYGLGLYRSVTSCGPIWGHDGGIPGYETIAWNDETGRRGVSIGLTTEPDAAIGQAFGTLVELATCRALGHDVPSSSATTRKALVSEGAWARRVDGRPVGSVR
jgi:D-alanyl-D-alanine carboxypeptidase